MVLGFATLAIGYAVFYWGLHHFPQYQNTRYSLWVLLGFGPLFKNLSVPAGQPLQWKTS